MKANVLKYGGWAVAILFLILWLRSCDKGETRIVETPEIKGSFPVQNNPAPNPAPKPVYKYLAGKTKTDTVTVENPINLRLWEYYQNAKQSKKDSLHASAIGEREYTLNNEDEFLKTTSHIKTRGELLSHQITEYTIKPQKVAVKAPETVLRLLAGAEVGSNSSFNQFTYKANIGLQNSKGNVIRASYQKVNNEDYFLIGKEWSIFNIRR